MVKSLNDAEMAKHSFLSLKKEAEEAKQSFLSLKKEAENLLVSVRDFCVVR